jgi:hypothetical protein
MTKSKKANFSPLFSMKLKGEVGGSAFSYVILVLAIRERLASQHGRINL